METLLCLLDSSTEILATVRAQREGGEEWGEGNRERKRGRG